MTEGEKKDSHLDREIARAGGIVMLSEELVGRIDETTLATGRWENGGVSATVRFDADTKTDAGSATGELVSVCRNPFRLVISVPSRQASAALALTAVHGALSVRVFDQKDKKTICDMGVEGMSVDASTKPDKSIAITVFDARKWAPNSDPGADIA